MQRHIVWSLLIALLIVLGLGDVAAAQQPRYGGTLRIAQESDMTGFDPHWSPGLQVWYMVGNLFNSLVTIDEHLNYIPEQKAFAKPFFEIIEAVEPLDAHTVKFTLKYPTQTFLPTLAIYRVGFLIKSPTTYKTWGKKDAHLHPTGTGAFKLARWEPNQVIVLEKNPEYFKKGLPYVDRIEYKIMKEGVTRATALRAGEVDFVNYVPKEMVERLSKDPKIRMVKALDIQGL